MKVVVCSNPLIPGIATCHNRPWRLGLLLLASAIELWLVVVHAFEFQKISNPTDVSIFLLAAVLFCRPSTRGDD